MPIPHRAPDPPRRLRRRGAFARALIGLWLGFYATVVGIVPLADAQAEHGQVIVHWEDASDTSCPPLHDASACQLCQLLSAGGRAPSARPDLATAIRELPAPAPSTPCRPPADPASAGNASRAPPVV